MPFGQEKKVRPREKKFERTLVTQPARNITTVKSRKKKPLIKIFRHIIQMIYT
jgi:hypothetical protein